MVNKRKEGKVEIGKEIIPTSSQTISIKIINDCLESYHLFGTLTCTPNEIPEMQAMISTQNVVKRGMISSVFSSLKRLYFSRDKY